MSANSESATHFIHDTEWWLRGKKICLPMQGTWVQSLDWEDPLEQERATHLGILAWEIPWTEEPGGLQSMGL